jgi:hypothetical protein
MRVDDTSKPFRPVPPPAPNPLMANPVPDFRHANSFD